MLIEKNHQVEQQTCSIQGKRTHMEDFFDVGYQMKPSDQQKPNEWPYEYFYLAIFDGHGGHEAASFARENLAKFITKEKDFWSTDDEDVMRAIRKGYSECHSAMREELPQWDRTSKILPSTAGTTASIIFIKNGKFYTGHVGDSRILISEENNETKNWISRQFTQDHKPESSEEVSRIERAGGKVRTKIGVHRVVWNRPVLKRHVELTLANETDCESFNKYSEKMKTYPIHESLVKSYQMIPFLAIARSLGDFWSINPYSGQYIVSPEPDVSCRPINPNDKCILLASDGLWNVMNSRSVSRVLQELDILKNGKRQFHEQGYFTTDNYYDVAGDDRENHAQSLVYIAYQIWERKRLRSDNITVVCAMLHDILAAYQASTETSVTPSNVTYTHQDELNKSLVQLGHTDNFSERILLNQEPGFRIPESDWETSKTLQKLETYLVFPPTLLEMESDSHYPKLVYPLNYMRLSGAKCRKISRFIGSDPDSFIYIKQISDDPDDYRDFPLRLSKSGKEVKDASSQATQSIHDFGQPWDELLDKDLVGNKLSSKYGRYFENYGEEFEDHEEEVAEDEDEEDEDQQEELEAELFFRELEGDTEHLKDEFDEDSSDSEDELDNDEDTELVFNHELEVHDEDEIESDEDKSIKKECEVRKAAIPQLRCLLNCTPPLRRSSRKAYQSVSNNAKRKVDSDSNTRSLPSEKRRKTLPIRCNLVHT